MRRRDTTITEITIDNGTTRPIMADLHTCMPQRTLPLVITCHGFLGYKRWGFFPFLSEQLAASGFHVLTMSFSMNGINEETGLITRPEEFARNTVSREVDDLVNVCRYIRGGGLPVAVEETCRWGLFGYSRGAAVALIVAARFDEIESLVTWATPSRLDRYSTRRKELWKCEGKLVFHDDRAAGPLRLDYSYYEDIVANWGDLDIPGLASSLRIPHLMVHCRRDAAVTLGETLELLHCNRRENMQLRIIEGCGHSFGVTHPMHRAGDEMRQAIALTRDWFTLTLRGTERSRIHAS
ncbi:MAG TPA: alpha/beta hydrolase [Patescibacteria group bacterium]|nr:alpha/beta hydrolase [Patescibacteria group bacterium]